MTGAFIGAAAAGVSEWAATAASRATSRYAAARAASVARTGVDYVGGGADFAMGAASRAAGMSAPGAPSAAGVAGELTGLTARGAIANGSQYQTNQQASFTAGGGMAGVPSQAAMQHIANIHSPPTWPRRPRLCPRAMGGGRT
jgi:hypothetical protein